MIKIIQNSERTQTQLRDSLHLSFYIFI